MRKKGHLTEGSRQNASGSPRAPYLKDVAERLLDVYVDTFKQAPEANFLLKRYFFTFYSPPYTFFLLNGDMELNRDRQLFV